MFKKSLTEQIDDIQTKASIIRELGIHKVISGEINEVIAVFKQSLALSEKNDDVQGQAATLKLTEYERQYPNFSKKSRIWTLRET